jgi:hypothetical protein
MRSIGFKKSFLLVNRAMFRSRESKMEGRGDEEGGDRGRKMQSLAQSSRCELVGILEGKYGVVVQTMKYKAVVIMKGTTKEKIQVKWNRVGSFSQFVTADKHITE